MQLTAYSINCRESDHRFLKGILTPEEIDIEALTLPELGEADPPADIVFVGWEEVVLKERPDLTTREVVGFMLSKIRETLSFRDVPVLVLAGRTVQKEAQVALKLGANKLLAAPLDRQESLTAIRDALGYAGTRGTVDVRIINPFADGTLEVLEKMAKTRAAKVEVFLKRDYRLFGEISALIDITGDRAGGSVGITFCKEMAWLLVGRMLNEDPANLTAVEVHDGLGELVNMISGYAETALANHDILDLRQSVPRIVVGHGMEITHPPGAPSLVIVFEAEGRKFAVQVALYHEQKNGHLRWQAESADL